MFGDAGQFSALVNSIADHGDYYLVSDDFKSYIDRRRTHRRGVQEPGRVG